MVLLADGLNSHDDSSPVPSPMPTPHETPYETPTYEPPELDRTQLEADMASLFARRQGAGRPPPGPSLGEGTLIVAAPTTVAEARTRLLGPSPQIAERSDFLSATPSAYAFLQVGDGVVAWESMGFADPPKRLLAELSRDGAVSAVVTDNIEAMTRDLARLAWSDPEGPMVENADWASVGLAMAEKVTGVRATADVQGVTGTASWYAVPLPWGAGE